MKLQRRTRLISRQADLLIGPLPFCNIFLDLPSVSGPAYDQLLGNLVRPLQDRGVPS
jgi:hypothetical protein